MTSYRVSLTSFIYYIGRIQFNPLSFLRKNEQFPNDMGSYFRKNGLFPGKQDHSSGKF